MTLVVTVAWAGRRRDLAVPADIPIADLLWPLALALTFPGSAPTYGAAGPTPPPGTAGPIPAAPEPDLALAPLGGGPLPADRTLGACGIGDGAILVLIDRRHPMP
jgi:hypothetical protein